VAKQRSQPTRAHTRNGASKRVLYPADDSDAAPTAVTVRSLEAPPNRSQPGASRMGAIGRT
jgi:hypothetical protein